MIKKIIKQIVSSKFRLGDNVIVTTGKNKNKTGDIIEVSRETGKVKVKGINLVSKFTKDSVDTKETFINVSNIQHIDAHGKESRVGFKLEDGKKIRFLKTTKKMLSIVTDYTKKLTKKNTEVSK